MKMPQADHRHHRRHHLHSFPIPTTQTQQQQYYQNGNQRMTHHTKSASSQPYSDQTHNLRIIHRMLQNNGIRIQHFVILHSRICQHSWQMDGRLSFLNNNKITTEDQSQNHVGRNSWVGNIHPYRNVKQYFTWMDFVVPNPSIRNGTNDWHVLSRNPRMGLRRISMSTVAMRWMNWIVCWMLTRMYRKM